MYDNMCGIYLDTNKFYQVSKKISDNTDIINFSLSAALAENGLIKTDVNGDYFCTLWDLQYIIDNYCINYLNAAYL